METLFVALRVVLSLGAVLVLLWWLQRRFARGGAGSRAKVRGSNNLAVVGRQAVGAKASVVVVEHDGHRFLLGVTEHGVNVLHTAEIAPDAATGALTGALNVPAEAPAHAEAQSADRFAQVLAEAGQTEELHAVVASAATTQAAAHATAQTEAERGERTAALASATPTVAPAAGKLGGSILAPETWKQAAAFVRNSR